MDRQAFGGLHNAEHHLARDVPVLRKPVLTDLACHF